jgi:hypothetical protein
VKVLLVVGAALVAFVLGIGVGLALGPDEIRFDRYELVDGELRREGATHLARTVATEAPYPARACASASNHGIVEASADFL